MIIIPPINVFPIITTQKIGDDKEMKKSQTADNKKLIQEVGKRYKLKECPGYNGSVCFVVLNDKVDIWPSTMTWMFRKTKYRKNGLHSLENDFLIRLDAFVSYSKGLDPEEFKKECEKRKGTLLKKSYIALIAIVAIAVIVIIEISYLLYYFFS